MIDPNGKAHAEFGASGSERWLNCPGSIKLSRKAPEPPESPYAIEGTLAHECLEELFRKCIWLSNQTSFESVMSCIRRWNPKNPKWDSEMIKNAKGATAWILKEFYQRSPGTEVWCEQKVSSEPFTTKGQFGTLDGALVELFGRLTIIDYKYGAGIAVEPDSPQLIYYALAASHMYNHNFSEVELVVIQPRAYHESGKKVRRKVISMNEMLSWEAKFQRGVKRALSKDPPLVSGKWCRFCRAAPLCPELVDRNFDRAKIAFDDDLVIDSVPEPRLVGVRDIGTMLAAADKLEVWIAHLREHAFHMMQRGEKIEGYKLVEKRGTRKYKDPEAAKKYWGDLAFGEPGLLSPAQLEKAVGVNKQSKAFVKKWLEKNTVTESSGLTMVSEDDKRLAIPGRAEHVFSTIIDV